MRLLAQHKRLKCSFTAVASDQPLLKEGEPEPPPPRGEEGVAMAWVIVLCSFGGDSLGEEQEFTSTTSDLGLTFI